LLERMIKIGVDQSKTLGSENRLNVFARKCILGHAIVRTPTDRFGEIQIRVLKENNIFLLSFFKIIVIFRVFY
jgi:hypothetical protein